MVCAAQWCDSSRCRNTERLACGEYESENTEVTNEDHRCWQDRMKFFEILIDLEMAVVAC